MYGLQMLFLHTIKRLYLCCAFLFKYTLGGGFFFSLPSGQCNVRELRSIDKG